MGVDKFFSYLSQLIFLFVAARTIARWIYRRDKASFDIALVFLLLAVAVLALVFEQIFPKAILIAAIIFFLALLAQPVALLRVASYFETVPKGIRIANVITFIVVTASLYFSLSATFVVVSLFLVYFGFFETYATFILLRAAGRTTGINRKRLVFASWGSGLFAFVGFVAFLVILLGLAVRISPEANIVYTLLTQGIAIASAVFFYLGFVPPRWLGRSWQFQELQAFLTTLPGDLDSDSIVSRLEVSALSTMGGRKAMVVRYDAARGGLFYPRADGTQVLLDEKGDEPMLAFWREKRAAIVRVDSGGMIGEWAAGLRTVLQVPIQGASRSWGFLLVALPYAPLFGDDDLGLLERLAEQSALLLDRYGLLGELKRANQSLEQKVDARTRELRESNAALRQTLQKLEMNNRELQDFAYVASHDLQEPLRKIQAFGDRLAGYSGFGLDEKARDYLERMQNAAARMQQLINDLLAFSRVTTAAQPFQSVDLNTVLSEVLSDLEIRIEKTRAVVEREDLPRIEADSTQMRQIFQNLIGNALKFHKPDAAPHISIRATRESDHFTLFVADDGIGFEEKYLDRIFTPFQRLHGRGEFEGTGIGLAIVRKIVERHQGTVSAKSEPDHGATFVVTLPLKIANA